LIVACCATAAQGAFLYGPSAYASFADSPFSTPTFDYFHLEDFEDNSFNTPGVVASTGSVLNFGTLRDSVDADDGTIDGSGLVGFSWYVTQSSITFTFDENVLGKLPTHAGVVITDIGFVLSGTNGISDITFEAFGPDDESLGVIGPFSFGDGLFAGQTDEDRFLGARNLAGISKFTVSANSADWEIDHVQYGAVPEPHSLSLMLAAAGLLGLRWRRRSHV
jgi:hypothetical protein